MKGNLNFNICKTQMMIVNLLHWILRMIEWVKALEIFRTHIQHILWFGKEKEFFQEYLLINAPTTPNSQVCGKNKIPSDKHLLIFLYYIPGTVLKWYSDRKTYPLRNLWYNRAKGCVNKYKTQRLCNTAKSEWSVLDFHFSFWIRKHVQGHQDFLEVGILDLGHKAYHQIDNVGRPFQERRTACVLRDSELPRSFVNST